MRKSFKHRHQKKALLDFLKDRSLGLVNIVPSKNVTSIEKYLPFHWCCKNLQIEKHNKIFASQWITNDCVVYGTKCNRFYFYNVENQTYFQIPLIKGITRESQCPLSEEPSTNFGIHTIRKNRSETLIATGAENVNSVGIYKIPEFYPQYILEDFHKDAIFDICWLDDSHVATCSRDSKMGIWNINPGHTEYSLFYNTRSFNNNNLNEDDLIGSLREPISELCLEGHTNRFRAMEYLPATSRLLIATMSNKLYCLDPTRLSKTDNQPCKTAVQDMVSLRQWPAQPHSFAVGGQARFSVYDSRCSPLTNECVNVLALHQNSGIRSLAFKDYVISYGTAEGHINFFDLKVNRHLTRSTSSNTGFNSTVNNYNINSGNACHFAQLKVEGSVEYNNELTRGGISVHPQTAVYTHEYDPTGTRMFAAGGPIAACINGQAACLFE